MHILSDSINHSKFTIKTSTKIVLVCFFSLKEGKISEKKSAEQRKIFKLIERDAEVYVSFVFAKKHKILPQF